MSPAAEYPELGADQLDPPSRPAVRRWAWLPRRRLALGVSATAAPTMLFVLLGALIGPSGLNLLGSGLLTRIQPIGWIALAVIGVYFGLGLLSTTLRLIQPVLTATAALALITVTLVAGGLYLLVEQSRVALSGDLFAAAILIGLCTSVSAAVHVPPSSRPSLFRAARVADLDDVPLLLLGVAALHVVAGGPLGIPLLATVAAGSLVGLAGWLLFEHADEAERGLFVTGAVLLLAGIGAYLGTSPLLSGCVAAIVWVRAPGPADRLTARDLRTLQHPLVALLLIIAGASTEWTLPILWVTAYIVVLRLAAKLLGSVLVAPMLGVSPAVLAAVLLQPGVLGIALAWNAAVVLGPEYDWILSAVTISAIASEVLAVFVSRIDEAAS